MLAPHNEVRTVPTHTVEMHRHVAQRLCGTTRRRHGWEVPAPVSVTAPGVGVGVGESVLVSPSVSTFLDGSYALRGACNATAAAAAAAAAVAAAAAARRVPRATPRALHELCTPQPQLAHHVIPHAQPNPPHRQLCMFGLALLSCPIHATRSGPAGWHRLLEKLLTCRRHPHPQARGSHKSLRATCAPRLVVLRVKRSAVVAVVVGERTKELPRPCGIRILRRELERWRGEHCRERHHTKHVHVRARHDHPCTELTNNQTGTAAARLPCVPCRIRNTFNDSSISHEFESSSMPYHAFLTTPSNVIWGFRSFPAG